MDNAVAVTYTTNMGRKMSHLNELTRLIWLWCIDKNFWLSFYHLAGTKIRRSIFSQERVTETLNGAFLMQSFKKKKKSKIILVFVILIYLHLRKKYKIKTYASKKPNIYASVTDAFSLSWKVFNLCLLGRVIQKIEQEKVEALWLLQCGQLSRGSRNCWMW